MAARAQHSTTFRTASYGSYADEDNSSWDIHPGDRVGAPLAGARRKVMLRGTLVVLIAIGGAWAMFEGKLVSLDDKLVWPKRLVSELASMLPAFDRKAPAPGAADASTSSTPALAPIVEQAVTPSPAGDAEAAAPNSSDSAALSASASPETTKPATTVGPSASATGAGDPTSPANQRPAGDPLAKRAEAVGLHPNLSRAILVQLSAADYRNAGIAISKAIATSADDAVLVWPPRRKPGLAQFRVHFVPGAAPACRRYIVTIAKGGWLTTALPVVKCGTNSVRKPIN